MDEHANERDELYRTIPRLLRREFKSCLRSDELLEFPDFIRGQRIPRDGRGALLLGESRNVRHACSVTVAMSLLQGGQELIRE